MDSTHTSDGAGFKKNMEGLSHQAGVIKDDIATLAHDAVGAARDGASDLRVGATHAVDAAKAKISQGKDYAKEQFEDAKAHAADAASSMKQYVVAHPLSSIGIAVGVGILAGIFLSRPRT